DARRLRGIEQRDTRLAARQRGVERTAARIAGGPVLAGEATQPRSDRAGAERRRQLAPLRQQQPAVLVGLAHDDRALRQGVERFLELRLDQRALLLDHQDLVAARAELADALGLERPGIG